MIQAIAHPTDFSAESRSAFAHALRLAVHFRCRLDLLHVRRSGDSAHWDEFPHVRETLRRWHLLNAGASTDDIATQTGVSVRKVDIHDTAAGDGLGCFLIDHRPDLIVMASHGRDGLNRWLSGSVASQVAHQIHVPTLVLGPSAWPFVNARTGGLQVGTVLVPVGKKPPPRNALQRLASLTESLGVTFDHIHVGSETPTLLGAHGTPISVRAIAGGIADVILLEAHRACLIAVPAADERGLFNSLRGPITERLVREAQCPVLTLPFHT